MTRHSVFRLLLLVALCAIGPLHAENRTASPRPPNIVFIYADDLGYGDLSCQGQTRFTTPNIDRLAAGGMRFTQHYSGSTVCAPARASLMTGRHTGHSPIRGNQELWPEGQMPLPADTPTIASVLRAAGFATGAFGKWGLGFVHTEGDPNRQGFDTFFGYNCQRWAHRYYPPYLWDNDQWHFLPGNDMYQTTTYAPDRIHARALEFIRRNRGRPFFLFVPTPLPHAELLAPDDDLMAEFAGKFPETPFPGRSPFGGEAAYGPSASPGGYAPQQRPRATFAAMVRRLDRHVGEILDLLEELGLASDTLVVFSSDNGPHREGGHDPDFFDSNGPFRGYKRDLYEGGIRVPLIARWPGHIPAGAESGHVCAGWDLLATFAEIAGATVPANTDGISFAPTLLGRSGQRTHDVLYWEFGERGGQQAVRWGPWKAVRTFAGRAEPVSFELFNLEHDPGETTDLAAFHPDQLDEARAWMERLHHPHPLFRLPFE